jgi:CHAT domain-containing protein
LRSRLANPQDSDDVEDKLRAAALALIVPVLPAIPGGTRQLIIVPAESLASVPFAALPLPPFGAEPARPLLERFAIAYLPSASTLQFLNIGPAHHESDVFLGALGDQSVDGLPALPGTLQETAAIQDLYPRAQRLVGAEFTHDAAVQALTQHAVVHFATHGLVDAQAPLFSALVTAPAEGRASRLSLYEVVDLQIKSRLVILSACETDLGQVRGGDEIIGLTRTFLQAGADGVVSSLWQVDDSATALLMATLHEKLRAGESASVALRHAQLMTRRRFPQPYYWAPFTANGLR